MWWPRQYGSQFIAKTLKGNVVEKCQPWQHQDSVQLQGRKMWLILTFASCKAHATKELGINYRTSEGNRGQVKWGLNVMCDLIRLVFTLLPHHEVLEKN